MLALVVPRMNTVRGDATSMFASWMARRADRATVHGRQHLDVVERIQAILVRQSGLHEADNRLGYGFRRVALKEEHVVVSAVIQMQTLPLYDAVSIRDD